MRQVIGEYFFFQAEDGIRDKLVTGVQTCALPICTADTAATCCGTTSTLSITPATRLTFPASARSDSDWRRNWRCCRSAPTIHRRFATFTPARRTPHGLFLI